ncbi:MAG: hypothetical protein ACLTDX_09165 [[Clostridium] innocuum]
MKTIFELNRYYIRRTLTSTRLVMPLVVTVVFCGIFYNENGINPYSSFAATIMLSFAIGLDRTFPAEAGSPGGTDIDFTKQGK